MTFLLPQPSEIDRVWPAVSQGLSQALERTGGDMPLAALYQQCVSGVARLLIITDAEQAIGACVVRPEVWTSGPKLRVLAMYGERLSEWEAQGLSALHELKRAFGASSIVFEGRAGWGRRPGVKMLRALYEVT